MFYNATAFDQDIGGWDVTALTNASYMFYGTRLSPVNYDALLIGWNAQTLKSGVTFDGGNSTYCLGESARNNMVTTDLWTITDGDKDCSDAVAPTLLSITRANTNPTSASAVNYTVTFSEDVTGVDKTDFSLTKTGSITGYGITGISGSGDTYNVTVKTGMYNGTLKLNVKSSGTGIEDLVGNDLDGGFTSGQAYIVSKTYSTTLKSTKKQDGWILEKAERSGKGGTKNAKSKVLKVGDDASNRQFLSILSFNTSSLPDNAVITKVTLKVKKAGKPVGKVSFKAFKGLRVDIRMPKFGSKPALQPADFQTKASKNYVGKFPSKLSSGWYVTTLNSMAYAYINKTGLTQFRLRFKKDDNNDFGADYLKLYSGNAPGAKRPQLIVEYYIP